MALSEEEKATWEAQVERASALYRDGGDPDIQADQDAREALSAETHDVISNEEVGLWQPGDKVQTRSDNPTEMASIVAQVADAGDLYEVGGPTDDWNHDLGDLSNGVDGLFLAERSKQTGEKYF